MSREYRKWEKEDQTETSTEFEKIELKPKWKTELKYQKVECEITQPKLRSPN